MASFSLARSASLGGARKRDPFGNQIDDVERALGDPGPSSLGGGGGVWTSEGVRTGSYQDSYGGHMAGLGQPAYDSYGRPGPPPSAGSGGGQQPRPPGSPGQPTFGGGHQHQRSVGELYPSSMTAEGLMRTGMLPPSHVPPPQSNRSSFHGAPPPSPSSYAAAKLQAQQSPHLTSNPFPSSPQLASHQMQQRQQQQQQQPISAPSYGSGPPPPPSQQQQMQQQQSKSFIPASPSQHAAPPPSASHPMSYSYSGGSASGTSPSFGGRTQQPSASWTDYSPRSTPQIEMRSSPVPPSAQQQQQHFRQAYTPPSSAASPSRQASYGPPANVGSNPYIPQSAGHLPPAPPPQLGNPYSQQQHQQGQPPPQMLQQRSASSSSIHYHGQLRSAEASYPQFPAHSAPGAHEAVAQYGQHSGSRDGHMAPPPAPEVPQQGFRRVSSAEEVRGRTPRHAAVRPLEAMTSSLAQTYSRCNPTFRYEVAHNPRRVLTKPSKGVLNDGHDNEDNDYILYVNDYLGTEEGHKFLILDVLGQGTFGQVVKCQNMKTNEIVAVKVVKNKPAYFNQSMMEVAILDELNSKYDPHDEHNILRMRAHFIHRKHLCLVFECLSSNLYELIKQNGFRGLSIQLVKVFTTQLLDTMEVLHEARLIHCDLKPENILLKSLQSPQIKVIDFGSACHEYSTVYTYIQSRFYRSPEVLLGLPYSTAIDMWSLGCIAVELFLGLPLFPGTSEYNQLSRIIDMLGMPPNHLLEHGKQVPEFFNASPNPDVYAGGRVFRFKSMEQYSKEHNTKEQPSKQYFKAQTLPEIIRTYTFSKKTAKQADIDREMAMRSSFTDFCLGLLNMDPIKRWSPSQARRHPFITGEKFTGPFNPSLSTPIPAPIKQAQPAAIAQAPPVDPRRPYGGLVATTSRAPRAYADAAAYNQQLNQHQTQVAQQQAAQAAASVYRHPFAPADDASINYSNQQRIIQQQQQQHLQAQHAHAMSQQQQQQQPHTLRPSASSSGLSSTPYAQRKASGSILPLPAAVHHSSQPSNIYYQQPTGRSRANTINQMDLVPASIARVTQLGVDPGGGRSPLTPVMNREEMMREWERRQQQQQNGAAVGKRASVNQPWQLEYLEGQAAELGGWGHIPSTQRYGPLPSSFVPPPQPLSVIVDDGSGRGSHQTDGHRGFPSSPASASIMSPPQAYSGAMARYPAYPSQSASSYDAYDQRDGLATLVQPLQPQQAYDPRHAAAAAPAVQQHSQLNPFAGGHGPTGGPQQQASKRQSTVGNDGWH